MLPNAAANLIATGAVNTPPLIKLLTVFLCTPIASASAFDVMPIGSRNSTFNISPTLTGRRFVLRIVVTSILMWV
ncbi:Uncharacterised protein [Vibrio cholerae]|nr:Uncharacterised protein [Vibrio cholerae]